MTFSPGMRLGPYEVRSFLSEGGMGEVYSAFDPRLSRQVAIKVLPPDLADLPEFRKRFERETQAISRLNHKNICTIYDTGTHEGRPYIVMELLEGKTVAELLAAGPLDVEQVVHIGIQVAAALDAAHGGGIVHRDIKTGNVVVNERGDAKVLDFGIAKIAAAQPETERLSGVTRAGVAVGTVAFMSPEQARAEVVDARSDIFSLGVVLYEMATGVSPFRGTATSIIAQLVSHDPVLSPRSLEPSIPVELDRVICRALEKDRELRYQTAADVLAALRAVGRSLAAGEISWSFRQEEVIAARSRRKRRWQRAAAAGSLLLAAGSVGWFALARYGGGDRPVHSMAVLPCSDREHGSDTEYLCSLAAERMISSLSQVPGLTVLGLPAVQRYVGDRRGAIAVGADLGVDAVLTTHIQQQGSLLSVMVEVTLVRNGVHLWGNVFRSPAAEAPGMPEEIALDVAENLQLRLSATDRARLRVLQTYQQAQYYTNDRTAASLRKAIALFDQVIRADSGFARAYVGLAGAYTLLHYYGDLPPGASYPRARAAAQRALELDENQADAHANLGLVKRDYDRDWVGAEKEFQRALELDPHSATALQWYAELLTMTGRFDEAEAKISEAQQVAPLSLTIRAVHGWVLMSAGRPEDARQQLDSAIAMNGDFQLSYWFLGQLAYARGDYGSAEKAFQTAAAKSGRPSRQLADLASAVASSGNRDEARALLGELEQRRKSGEYVSSYDMAIVRAGLGDRNGAFQELDSALKERTWEVANIAVDPMLRPLHADPRFRQVLMRAGLQVT